MNKLKDKIEIENKKIDSLDKEANIIYKKLFVLLAIEAGIGSLLFKFNNHFLFILLIFFSIIGIAVFKNYYRLGILKEEAKEINSNIKRLSNE